MGAKFDLDEMLASGKITDAEYEAHMKRRNAAAQRNGSPNKVKIVSGGIKSANAKMVRVAELDLLAYADTLKAIQAGIEDGNPAPNDAEVLGDLATTLEKLVNPLRAQLPQLEEDLGALNIQLAEAQLELAKVDAEWTRVKRTLKDAEHPDALALGKLVGIAAEKVKTVAKERDAVRADHYKASRTK